MKTNQTLIGIVTCLTLFNISSSVSSQTILSEVNGNVKIKRENWTDFHKITNITLLEQKDQIQLDSNASATITCSNFEKWQPQPGKTYQISEGCPDGTPFKQRPGIFRQPTRSQEGTIPYIISPRNTALLNDRPLLRWNAVSGATHYKVRLENVSLTFDWEIETTNTEIQYPSDQPPLKPDSFYILTVETDLKQSSKNEEGNDLTFTILDTQKAESIRKEIANIKRRNLAPEVEGLRLASLYESYHLKAEAIQLLEDLVTQGSKTIAIYQLLGDLYLQIPLIQQGKNSYQKALELAKQNDYIEGKAVAQEKLGYAYYEPDNKQKAINFFREAQKNYNDLGDRAKVEELEKLIAEF